MVTSVLENLDYADDIGLVSSRHNDMKANIDKLAIIAPQIGLKMNIANNKLMKRRCKTKSETVPFNSQR